MVKFKARQAPASTAAHPDSPRVEIALETTEPGNLLCGNIGSDADVDAAIDDLQAQLERVRQDAKLLLKT